VSSGLASRENNFDLLRFVLSFIVFLVHAYVLSGAEALSVLTEFFSSKIAVESFFVVSGFLIFMSYENTRVSQRYFVKRVRRIYPAYFFVIIASVVVGFFLSNSPWNDYFLGLLKYIAANLFFLNFLQPSLPGLFDNNIMQAVNGALWILKIEVMFYLSVPFIVFAYGKLRRLPVLIGLYLLSACYSLLMDSLAIKTGSDFYLELQRQLPGQLTYFIFQSWLPLTFVEPVALGVLVVYLACVLPSLGHFGKYGDFSYGIYILHFPILQVMVSYGLFGESPWVMLFVSGVFVIVGAIFLWHFIEKPFLAKSSHYVETTIE